MAILENLTQHYYKINFEECSVRGRRVYVNFSSYASEAERIKEKDRQDKQHNFFDALQKHLYRTYNELVAKIEKLGIDSTEVMSLNESNKIDKEKYPELRAEQDELNNLESNFNYISNNLYNFGDKEVPLNCDNLRIEILKEFGFEPEWITDPIRIDSGAEVYVGDYNDEKIDQEFYYNRLKTVMSENIADC